MRERARLLLLFVFGTLAGSAIGQVTPTAWSSPAAFELNGSEPNDVAVADFDADGNLDLAISGAGGNEGTILIGDGAGGFADNHDFVAVSSVYDPGPWGITAADFDGDGFPDVATTSGGGWNGLLQSNHKVEIFHGLGNGDLAWQATLQASGAFPIDCEAADLDGDGDMDLAVICNHSSLCTFLNDGTGSFGPALSAGSTPQGGHEIRIADMDGDGFLDLVTLWWLTGLIYWGDGTGSYSLSLSTSLVLQESFALGDVDRDGRIDVVTWQPGVPYNLTSGILVYRNLGQRTFAPVGPTGTAGQTDIEVGDFNADGILDVAGLAGNLRVVHRGIGDGTFVQEPGLPGGIQPASLITGDWNGDGFVDLASPYRNYGDTPWVTIYLDQTNPGPWTHLGFGLEGPFGLPLLRGSGDFTTQSVVALSVTHGPPSAAAALVAGDSVVASPLAGGVLVPNALIVLPLSPTDTAGSTQFTFNWPGGANGLSIVLQAWLGDPSAPNGVVASNGLSALIP